MQKDLQQRPLYSLQKRHTYLLAYPRAHEHTCARPLHMPRDLYACKETYIYAKRPTDTQRDQQTRKETYIHAKRPLHMPRDQHACKETYIHAKRPTDTEKDLDKTPTNLLVYLRAH